MPEQLYVLAPGEGESGEWISPQPLEEGIAAAVAANTDLDTEDVDDVESYVDLDDIEAVLEGDDEETLSFEAEGHDVVVDASGHVRIDPE